MLKKGYCPIEKKITLFRKLDNEKWLCVSTNCSGAAGTYKTIPKQPEQPKPEHYFEYV